MPIIDIVIKINNSLAVPTTLIFLIVAVILTLRTNFLQIRTLPRLYKILTRGIKNSDPRLKTISPIQALFSAMTTTIGMGNIAGPTMAIALGGPGALFWLIVFILLSMVVKFVEVTFAITTRSITKDNQIIGGPAQYLKLISHKLAHWYAIFTLFLFIGWSSLQTNTLANIYAQENIPTYITGLAAALLVLLVVYGGIKRIGWIATKIIPIVFILYVSYTLIILVQNLSLVHYSMLLIFKNAFSSSAAISGFLGATIFTGIKEGIYKSVFITESGLGTSSIAHAFSDVKDPKDQGILAMFSGIANIFLCTLSGLLALVTGVWTNSTVSSAMVYGAFSQHSPIIGKIILLLSVTLFVIITIMGNTFNGSQSFASLWGYRFINFYYILAAIIIFLGSLVSVPLIWAIMDIMLALVAIPNVICVLLLALRYPEIIKI